MIISQVSYRTNGPLVLKMTMGMLFFWTKYILHISAFLENNNFSSFDFLMGDNSVDIIPPALDNGEPTRQWRIK